MSTNCVSMKLTGMDSKFREKSNSLASCADVLRRTSNFVNSRRRFIENVNHAYQNVKRTCGP